MPFSATTVTSPVVSGYSSIPLVMESPMNMVPAEKTSTGAAVATSLLLTPSSSGWDSSTWSTAEERALLSPALFSFLLTIYPISNTHTAKKKINDYNEQLKVLAGEKGVGYIDVHAALQNADGVLDAEASPKDGMHFGRSTYEKWFAYLRSETGAQEANG